MDVLVTYDISTIDTAGERRLARVAGVCERYGRRVQYSVFECRLDDILLQRLITDVLAEIEVGQDSVNIYRLVATVEKVKLSLGRTGHDWSEPWVM